jgi:flagellar FliL protein
MASEAEAELEQTPEEEAAPSGGGLKAKLPILAAIIVGLAVGGGSGAKLIGPLVVKKLHLVKSTTAAADSAAADSADAEPKGKKGEQGKASNAPPVLNLDNLVLNPAGSGGSRFLLMTVAVECATDKVVQDLTAREPELRDLVLTTLGNRTVDELTDMANREGMKTEVMNAINERFGKRTVKRLYFPQFVIQ